jgi:hypothetical protein
LEMMNCVRLLRWRPKGLLLAEFALTGKVGRVRGALLVLVRLRSA